MSFNPSFHVDKFVQSLHQNKQAPHSIKVPSRSYSGAFDYESDDDNEDNVCQSPTEILHSLAGSYKNSYLGSPPKKNTPPDNNQSTSKGKNNSPPSTVAAGVNVGDSNPESSHDKRELLLLFLLQHVCRQFNPDPAFYAKICKALLDKGYIQDQRSSNVQYLKQVCKDFMIEVQQLQLGDQTFGKRKSSLLRRSESAESIGLRRVSTQDVFAGFSDFPYFDVMFKTPSRYISDFLQRQKLGKGTFGSVYTAKHRIDGQEYAVKKIKIGFSNTKELEVTYNKVIREVKSLAALDHPNIVRYHQAWFEPWREEEKSAAEQHYSLEEPSEEFDDEESHSTEGSAPQQGAVKRSLLSEQLNKLNVDDAQDDILFEMDQSLPGRNPSVEFSFDQSPGIGGVQIYENAESEEDDDEPIRNQRVIPESPMASPNMSYLEMAYKQKFKKPSAVLSPTREEPPAPPSIIVNEEDQELQDVRGFLTEIFNEKNLRFEMVLYIQMQLCAPATLETWLWSETRTQERKVDLHAVFHYFRQVVNAIAYVHKNGLIHRDIKPSNIFITHDDRIRIGDFGLAKYIRENLEESPVPPTPTEPTFGEQPPAANRNQNLNANHTTTLSKRKGSPVASAGEHTSGVGTYIYASPEQLAGSQYDETVDVFSLGMILFEMLHPFATKAERAVVLSKVHDFAQIPEYMQQQYPQEMNLVKRCVSKHPKDRPRASEVLINIEKIAAARGLLKPEQNSSLNESMKDLLEEKERMIREQQEMIQKLKAELSKVQKTHTLVQ